MDRVSSEKRSAIMRAIRSEGMRPELLVRSLVHRAGYRFRLHRRSLPGTPDLVFPSRKKVIFVHGCFWHGHGCARGGRSLPKTNAGYWHPKISRNKTRDTANLTALNRLGWRHMVIWECELENQRRASARLRRFLKSNEKATHYRSPKAS